MSFQRLRLLAVYTVILAISGDVANAQQPPPAVRIDLDQAIQLALEHNHALKAAETQIQQSQAEEVTASLRPNPVLTWDALFVPFFSPDQLNKSYLNNITEFDAAVAYTFERGHKRQARIQAARDQTAQMRSLVSDNRRTMPFNVAHPSVGVLLHKSTLGPARLALARLEHRLAPGDDPRLLVEVAADAVTPAQLEALRRELAGWVEESREHRTPFGTPTIDGRPRFDMGEEHNAERPALRRVNNPSDISAAYMEVVKTAAMTDRGSPGKAAARARPGERITEASSVTARTTP